MMLSSLFKEDFSSFQQQVAAAVTLNGNRALLEIIAPSERSRIEKLLLKLSTLDQEWQREICAETLLQCSR